MSQRMVLALLLNMTLCAAALWSVVAALFPRWSRGGRARLALRVAVPLTVLCAGLLELAARRWAPLGGGPWRVLLGVERASLVGALFAGICLAATRALTWLLPSKVSAPSAVITDLSRREALARGGALGAAGVATAGALWGGLRHRHDIAVTELEVFVDGLPPHLEGLSLVQLTDLHIGIFTGRQELLRLVELTRRLDADHVVITGDILDYSPKHIPEGLALLSRVRARHGTYAVLGNHDHYAGPRRVYEGLRRVGITPLVNGAVRLTGGAREGIVLAGVDDVMAARIGSGRGPDLASSPCADSDRRRPVVLLAHNPMLLRRPDAHRPALQLSGHTHGGQINTLGVDAGAAALRGRALHPGRRRGDLCLSGPRGDGSAGAFQRGAGGRAGRPVTADGDGSELGGRALAISLEARSAVISSAAVETEARSRV
jgi:predicted MPP superfamily phosphohydrolase